MSRRRTPSGFATFKDWGRHPIRGWPDAGSSRLPRKEPPRRSTTPASVIIFGDCLATGTGVSADPAQAVQLFRETASAHPVAVGNLAECFELGRGVPKNWVEAGRLYREAAERGWPSAQCNYARFLENGMGVPANLDKARAWYAKAAAQGDAKAAQATLRLAAAIGGKS